MDNSKEYNLLKALKLLKYMGFEEIDTKMTRKDPFREILEDISGCSRCRLSKNRNNIVFGDGPSDASILFIGEAPGREEDEQGIPFVGAAGEWLDRMLESAGIDRNEVFITNVVKCRPPGNRNPKTDEKEKCRKYLDEQIEIIQPDVIVLLGNVALSLVTGETGGITKKRGKIFEFMSYPAIPTFHPAYVLRNPSGEKTVIKDLKKAKGFIND